MARFYFTYGTSGQPFAGGWTEVEAPDKHMACVVFRRIHPDKTEGLLNCSSVYTQEEFLGTGMVSGNFAACCHEYISLKQYEKEWSGFELLKQKLVEATWLTNKCADDMDLHRNLVNYGMATGLAGIIEELGHKISIPCAEDDNGCLRIPYFRIDGVEYK